MRIDEILSRLQSVKAISGGYIARCPAHEDVQPSLKVAQAADGKILMHCHAGCSAEDVCDALGIKLSDLMPPKEAPAPTQKQQLRAVAQYDYQDEEGALAYRVIRYEPKTFRIGRFDADGNFLWGADGVTRYPYRLPAVIETAKKGGIIVVCEGEKDADALVAKGYCATTNAGGAGKWVDAWAEYFKGASRVLIVSDNDTNPKLPGQRHAWQTHCSMTAAGIQNDVFVMPGTGKDVSDFIAAGGDLKAAFQNHEKWPKEWKFTDDGSDDSIPLTSLADFPPYEPEETNRNILIKGRWLERGGSAFWISTAGTGKSIACVQLAMCMSEGHSFAGLEPNGVPLKFWIVQSEDSPSRVTIDREDICAELAEQYPDTDWRATCTKVQFVNSTGKVGADFLDELDRLLAMARRREKLPDVVVLNPLLAYIGGPITDGAYVTPFLRGGQINGKDTLGLQAILERYNIAALIFHHTPKPPTEKEIDAWMSSTFPEYQGAGSSDITNWGRSFITMMRVKGRADMVALTAGKNGSELGWERIKGAYRHYLAYSNGKSITGRGRHAWRELDENEQETVVGGAKQEEQMSAEALAFKLAEELKREALSKTGITRAFGTVFGRNRVQEALKLIYANPMKFRLTIKYVREGRAMSQFVGSADSLARAEQQTADAAKLEDFKARAVESHADDDDEEDGDGMPF